MIPKDRISILVRRFLNSHKAYMKKDKDMIIIDFHTHIYPVNIAGKATREICNFYNLREGLMGTSAVLLEEGKKAGISRFVLLPVATKPEQVRHINQYMIDETKAHPELIGFGTLHVSMDHPLAEISFIESNGLKGVKLHPDVQRFAIDDKRLFPIYDQLQGRLPVLIHCGDPRYSYSRPDKLRKVLLEFPRLQVIAAHLGGWSMYEEAFGCLRDTNCYFDISSCMMFLSPAQMVRYISGYGADRILFGSDFPIWNPQNEVRSFLNLNLTEKEREKIAFINAQQLLKIK